MERKQLLIKNPDTGQMINLSGVWDLFNAIGQTSEDFNETLTACKQKVQILSRKIFNDLETDDLSEFKDDINFFLYFGDFLNSVKVQNQ